MGVDIFGDIFAVPAERNERSVGSGVVIHQDGYIATNAHVASSGAQLKVTFADGMNYDAEIIGRDTLRDLAVLKIQPDKSLTPIPLGRSDDLLIGEQTIAIGNPVGLQNTLTTGVISALHRELRVEGRVVYRDVIQTDASINPGNSGGPLLNILGELIGINTAIRTDAQNIGFAIPVDQLREMLPDILDAEKLNNVVVGMRVSGLDPPRVIEVRENGPAHRAGIRVGDTVDAIDGKKLDRAVDFHVALLSKKPGDAVGLRLRRAGTESTARVTLAPAPKPDGKELAALKLGAVISDVSDKAAKRFRRASVDGGGGVIVMAVEPQSPAERADLQPGDLLVSMGPYWVTNVNQVGTLLSHVGPDTPIDVGFRREHRGRLYEGETRLHAR